MKFTSVKASRLDLQKDGSYKWAYKDREVLKRSAAKQPKAKKTSSKPKAA